MILNNRKANNHQVCYLRVAKARYLVNLAAGAVVKWHEHCVKLPAFLSTKSVKLNLSWRVSKK
jgi:hypothetical protein